MLLYEVIYNVSSGLLNHTVVWISLADNFVKLIPVYHVNCYIFSCAVELMGLLGEVSSARLSSVNFYLIFFISVSLSLILMKLAWYKCCAGNGLRNYRDRILNICINYAN